MRTAALLLASFSIANIFHAAEKDAPGGTGGAGTLKDQLEAAKGKIGTLEGEKSQLSTDLDTEKGKVTKLDGEKAQLALDLKTANEKVIALTGEKSQLTADLAKANGKVAALEGDKRTVDDKAGERAAANGMPPVHTEAAKTEASAKDGAALYGEYKTLKGREKTAFYRENEKALAAYAKEQAKAGN